MDELIERPTVSFSVESDADGTSVVVMTGELDLSTVEAIQDELPAVLDRVGDGKFVIDAGGLSFMDSSGLALLVWAAKQVGSVSIRGASSTIKRIIELTGLETVLTIEDAP